MIRKIGYKRGIIVGLITAGVGCALFYPAAGAQSYAFFLGALFILASGIAFLQVAANPYVLALGKPETASSRLNLTQAFNSLGATLGPLLGATVILGIAGTQASSSSNAAAQAAAVQTPYLVLTGILLALAAAIWLVRLPVIEEAVKPAAKSPATATAKKGSVCLSPSDSGRDRHLAYVGAEVGIGSFLVSLMGQPQIAGLTPEAAGRYLSIYWGAAMVGRFIGSALMTKIKPARLLAFNALMNVVLIALAMLCSGHIAMWALIAVGFFNSIMFRPSSRWRWKAWANIPRKAPAF